MLRSLYISASAMLTQRKQMDVMTNNITNVETVGYKKDSLLTQSFEDMLIQRINDPDGAQASEVGQQNFGLHIDEVYTSFEQGSLETTDRLTDIALQGDGFFTITTSDGERYTRNGAFGVNSQGYLVDADGNYVAGENDQIYVGDGEFTIDDKGYVCLDGETTDRLRVVAFEDTETLEKDGDNMFSGTGAVQYEDAVVKQGCLENSNVDIAEEMVDVLAVSRSYETNQRVIKMLDETLDKTVNEVGRV